MKKECRHNCVRCNIQSWIDVTLDKSTPVQANYSFWMFGTVPAFLFIISVTFYMLSIAKKKYVEKN